MAQHDISYDRLQQIIKEEVTAVTEALDHKGISDVVAVASKLLAALENFKAKAPGAAINAVTPHLGEMEKVLENMISTPGSYVAQLKKQPQKVTLKAMKKEGKLREASQSYPPEMDRDAGPEEGQPCQFCGSTNTEQLEPIPSMAGYGEGSGLTCLDCKKTSWAGPEMHESKAVRVTEATGGDGKLERVTEQNWQHLEVGNEYLVKHGRMKLKCGFVGWVDQQGAPTESEDPTQVNLKFVELGTGKEWEAYFFDGGYAVGSSADKLYVKEL
jgi:hypothetical protein